MSGTKGYFISCFLPLKAHFLGPTDCFELDLLSNKPLYFLSLLGFLSGVCATKKHQIEKTLHELYAHKRFPPSISEYAGVSLHPDLPELSSARSKINERVATFSPKAVLGKWAWEVYSGADLWVTVAEVYVLSPDLPSHRVFTGRMCGLLIFPWYLHSGESLFRLTYNNVEVFVLRVSWQKPPCLTRAGLYPDQIYLVSGGRDLTSPPPGAIQATAYIRRFTLHHVASAEPVDRVAIEHMNAVSADDLPPDTRRVCSLFVYPHSSGLTAVQSRLPQRPQQRLHSRVPTFEGVAFSSTLAVPEQRWPREIKTYTIYNDPVHVDPVVARKNALDGIPPTMDDLMAENMNPAKLGVPTLRVVAFTPRHLSQKEISARYKVFAEWFVPLFLIPELDAEGGGALPGLVDLSALDCRFVYAVRLTLKQDAVGVVIPAEVTPFLLEVDLKREGSPKSMTLHDYMASLTPVQLESLRCLQLAKFGAIPDNLGGLPSPPPPFIGSTLEGVLRVAADDDRRLRNDGLKRVAVDTPGGWDTNNLSLFSHTLPRWLQEHRPPGPPASAACDAIITLLRQISFSSLSTGVELFPDLHLKGDIVPSVLFRELLCIGKLLLGWIDPQRDERGAFYSKLQEEFLPVSGGKTGVRWHLEKVVGGLPPHFPTTITVVLLCEVTGVRTPEVTYTSAVRCDSVVRGDSGLGDFRSHLLRDAPLAAHLDDSQVLNNLDLVTAALKVKIEGDWGAVQPTGLLANPADRIATVASVLPFRNMEVNTPRGGTGKERSCYFAVATFGHLLRALSGHFSVAKSTTRLPHTIQPGDFTAVKLRELFPLFRQRPHVTLKAEFVPLSGQRVLTYAVMINGRRGDFLSQLLLSLYLSRVSAAQATGVSHDAFHLLVQDFVKWTAYLWVDLCERVAYRLVHGGAHWALNVGRESIWSRENRTVLSTGHHLDDLPPYLALWLYYLFDPSGMYGAGVSSMVLTLHGPTSSRRVPLNLCPVRENVADSRWILPFEVMLGSLGEASCYSVNTEITESFVPSLIVNSSMRDVFEGPSLIGLLWKHDTTTRHVILWLPPIVDPWEDSVDFRDSFSAVRGAIQNVLRLGPWSTTSPEAEVGALISFFYRDPLPLPPDSSDSSDDDDDDDVVTKKAEEYLFFSSISGRLFSAPYTRSTQDKIRDWRDKVVGGKLRDLTIPVMVKESMTSTSDVNTIMLPLIILGQG